MAAGKYSNQRKDRGGAAGDDAEERTLLASVAGGDRDALTELYRLYHSRLFKFIFRLTRSYTAADELVNDIMLVVWQNAANFRGESKVSTWIFGIAYRKAMRRMSRKRMLPLPGNGHGEPAADDTADIETEDWVRRGLDELPAAQQLTVMLVFYLGMSYPEVAEVTGCPVNTVKTRMFHARCKLRECLANTTGGSQPGHGHE